MEISVDKSGAFPVVRILGDMRLWGKQGFADQVREALHSLMHAGNKKIVLSLAQVTRIDSRGIGCLARCHATAITQKADLALVLSKGQVLDSLTQLNFVRLCPIYMDESSAIQSFLE
jgi:anti-anti-sigma factor